MKKSIFIAVLGIAASVASSYGQGVIVFSSYLANSGNGATTTTFESSTLVPAGYSADLYYFLGSVSDPVNNTSAASISTAPTGLTDLGLTGVSFATGIATPGYFDGPTPTIPGYTSGPVTFEVVAYNGTTWANSTERGRSGSFTMTSIPLLGNPAISLGETGFGAAMPNFFVAAVSPVPEPTTLALAGLGGLASLVALRRKQA